MFPSIYTGVYNIPFQYQVSQLPDLRNNTDFPNTNSIEYRSIPIDRTIRMHPIWERIAMNKKGHIVIGTNKAYGREWNSTFWGFDNLDKINEQSSRFRVQNGSHVSELAFYRDTLLFGAFRNGGVQIWSTYNQDSRKDKPLTLIGKRFEHERPIECFELMDPEANKAISGGQDYKLKIWDFGEAELQSVNTYRYAHLDTIHSIAVMKTDSSVFATASQDKSILLWDIRNILPAHALYENHRVGFKHVIWADPETEKCDTYLYAGDESGFVHCIDKRQINQFVDSKKLADRPIRKLAINGDNLAVIANTNVVTVYSISKDKVRYTNETHTHLVRDCIWKDPTTLLTVGCDSKLNIHKIGESG